MIAAPATKRRLAAGITAGVCAALLIMFAVMSLGAARGWFGTAGKSATYDEPLHVLGAYVHRYHSDFRINPEDPALFGWVISLGLREAGLRVDTRSPIFEEILNEIGLQWPFIWTTMYRTPRNDEQMMLNRSRAMTVLIGVILGAVIAWWAYLLAGPVAAVGATALYAFDPNFLAHAAIVKNDVPLSCVLMALMLCVWLLGKRATVGRLAAVTLLCGAAVSIKYSGVLAGPIVALALLIRALLPQPWQVIWLNLATRWQRLLAVVGMGVVFLLVSWVMIWAVYSFRFRPAPPTNASFNMDNLVRLAKIKEISVRKLRATREAERLGQPIDPADAMISPQEIDQHQPGRIVGQIAWLEQRQLLPQGWLVGFLYTYATTLVRSTYLNGEVQQLGWWSYFPRAMLYKTPLATLAAMGAALIFILVGKLRYGPRSFRRIDYWGLTTLLVAPVLYGASAINANLNLGLRHVLPVYPFIYIGIGVAVSLLMTKWRMVGSVVATVLAVGLVVESVAAYPNYIPFFNAWVGGARGGFHRLGDSNLDWGQDLKLLAEWQQDHPDKKLYLSYFGIADPESYGVKATHLPGGYVFAQQQWTLPDPSRPSVLAVSATQLQGIYLAPELKPSYDELKKHKPFEILGGSIYLYHFPMTSSAAGSSQND